MHHLIGIAEQTPPVTNIDIKQISDTAHRYLYLKRIYQNSLVNFMCHMDSCGYGKPYFTSIDKLEGIHRLLDASKNL